MISSLALSQAISSPSSTSCDSCARRAVRLTLGSDFFNLKTEDDTFQSVIDMLLNLAIFFWLGAACPWRLFLYNETVPLYRLVLLGILILLFRRLPIVFALRWKIRQIRSHQDALFTGYFGPIGVAAMFYLHLTVQTLHEIEAEQPERDDLARLSEVVTIVVWFITICSIVSSQRVWEVFRVLMTVRSRTD